MSETCRLCGADSVLNIFKKDEIRYHKCTGCHFVFSRPLANANLENRIEDYEPAYMDYLTESTEDEGNLSDLLRWAQGFGAIDGKRVLDIGTGSGKLVRFLRRSGIDAYGIEPARLLYARFLAGEAFFFPSTIENFSDELPVGKFTAVFACDVIEHVERPDVFLERISRVLKPGGRLFVTTPDVGSQTARLMGRRWHHYNKYHLSYLCRQTIVTIAARAGLREVGFSHPPRGKSIGYVIQYLADFVFGGGRLRVPERINNLVVPVNIYDTMHVAFEMTGNHHDRQEHLRLR